MRNSNINLNDEDSKIVMNYHFYIFDDKIHDSYFVQHCVHLHWEDLVKGGFKRKQHWIWSNGCSFQFKNKIPLYFVSHYFHSTCRCICTWSFFSSRHKEGPHDGWCGFEKVY